MLEIGLYRSLVCDNGKTYMICEGNEHYDFKLREGSWHKEVNMVDKCYLEDAIKYNYTICVGRLDNGNCEYTTIIDIEGSQRDKMKIDTDLIMKSIGELNQMSLDIRETIAKSKDRNRLRRI